MNINIWRHNFLANSACTKISITRWDGAIKQIEMMTRQSIALLSSRTSPLAPLCHRVIVPSYHGHRGIVIIPPRHCTISITTVAPSRHHHCFIAPWPFHCISHHGHRVISPWPRHCCTHRVIVIEPWPSHCRTHLAIVSAPSRRSSNHDIFAPYRAIALHDTVIAPWWYNGAIYYAVVNYNVV